jgi:hypothetical protein
MSKVQQPSVAREGARRLIVEVHVSRVVRRIVILRLTIDGMSSSSADILWRWHCLEGVYLVSSTTPKVDRAKGLQRVVPRLSWPSPLCSKSNVAWLLHNSPHPATTMSTSNLGRFFRERYRVAASKLDTDKHEDALSELTELLMEDKLSPIYRLKANAALADGVDDWFLAEQYRLAAELAYDGICEVLSDSERRLVDDEIAILRELLDSLAEEQRLDDPRQTTHDNVAHHSDLAPEAISTSGGADNAMEHTDTQTAEARSPVLTHTTGALQGSAETIAHGQSSSDVLPTFGISRIPIRQNTTPSRTNARQQMDASSRRSKTNTPTTPNSIPKHLSASDSSRQRSPDREPFTGSPSKKKSGGAQ